MRAKRNKTVVALAVTGMLLSSVNVNAFAATKKEVVVTSQAELRAELKAMGKNGTGSIVLENNKKTNIKIPKGNFGKVKLYVTGSKLSVENKGRFKSVNLEGDGVKKFVESAKNNSIKVTSAKANIVISNKAVLKSLNCSGDNLSLTVNKGSKVGKVLANEGVKNLTLNVDGKVNNATIKAQGVQVRVKGTADDTKLIIEGENVNLKAETAVKLTLLSNADITFEKGAEKSVIEVKEGAEVKISNNTEEKITVNTPEGEKTISSGDKMENTAPKEENKTEDKKEENKKEDKKTGGSSSDTGSLPPAGGGGSGGNYGGGTTPGTNESIKSGFSKEVARIELKPSFYPVVRKLEFNNEGLKIKDKLNVAVVSDKRSPAVKKFFELLDEHSIAYNLISRKDAGKADIVLGTKKARDKSAVEKFFGDEALSNEQGYILNCVKEADGNRVFLVGASDEGLYYGVMSFRQMLEDKKDCGYLPIVNISDYPSIPLRGFVEGYYGYPWPFEAKMGLIKDSSKYKMNVYIYAPKDDPYHKSRWRELYPEDKANELKQLAEVSTAHNVSFCWNIHPGNISADGGDFELLMNKFEQLYQLGVRQFGVSYDDISANSAAPHIEVINKVNKEFVKKKRDVKPLIVVGTRYAQAWGPDVNSYLKPFLKELDEDVIVMWTGAETMGTLNKEDFEWPAKQTGTERKLAAWWNYPVIDYADGKMLMGPLDGVHNDADNLLGVFLNPMPHAQASRIAIYSGADYSWNLNSFEKMSSWRRAIKELVPDEKEAFERFADNLAFLQKEKLDFDESRYIKEKLDEFTKALSDKEKLTEKAEDLKTEFEKLIADSDALRNMKNKELLEEVKPFIDAYEEVAKAGVAAMEGILAVGSNDFNTALDKIDVFEQALAKSATFTVKSLEDDGKRVQDNIVQVCEKRIKPFIKDVAGAIRQTMVRELKADSKSYVYISSDNMKKDLERVGGNYVADKLNATLKKNDYIELKLPKALKIAKVSVTGEALEGADVKLSYSVNTDEYTEEELKNTDGKLATEKQISASVVRVTNKGDKEVKIEEIKTMIVYGVSNVEIETKMNHYGNHRIKNAIDGNLKTKFWSNGGPAVGSYVRIDLGKVVPLHDLKIIYGCNPKGKAHGLDAFFDTKLEISEDGVTWVQIGDVIDKENYKETLIDIERVVEVDFDAEGKMGRYLKFSTTKQSDNWVQIYEVLYNEKANNLGDDKVNLIETDCAVDSGEKLYDGNLNTAPYIGGVAADKYLTYKLSKTDAKNIYIIQSKENICNAEVFAKVDGTLKSIGTLDKRFNSFSIDGDKVTEIKLVFKTNTAPEIYEIFAK